MTANKKLVWQSKSRKMRNNKYDLTTTIKRKYRNILIRQPIVVLQDIFSNANIIRRYLSQNSNSQQQCSQIKYTKNSLGSKKEFKEQHETSGTQTASQSSKKQKSLATKAKNVNHSHKHGHAERNKNNFSIICSDYVTYVPSSSDETESSNKKRVRKHQNGTETILKRLKTEQNERRKRKAVNTDVSSDYSTESSKRAISITDSDYSLNKINSNKDAKAPLPFGKSKRKRIERRIIISETSSSSVLSEESSSGDSTSTLSGLKDNERSTVKKSNTSLSSTQKNLPIITDDNILPKGTIQLLKSTDHHINVNQNGVDLAGSKVTRTQEVNARIPAKDCSNISNVSLNTSRHSILIMGNYPDDHIKEVLDKKVYVPERDDKHDNNQEIPETASISTDKVNHNKVNETDCNAVITTIISESSHNSSSVTRSNQKNNAMSFKMNSLRDDSMPVRINESPSTLKDSVNNDGQSIKNKSAAVKDVKCDNNKVASASGTKKERELGSSAKCAKDVKLLPLTQDNLRIFTKVSDNRNDLVKNLPKIPRLSNRDLKTDDKRQVKGKQITSIKEKNQSSQEPSISNADVTGQVTINTTEKRRIVLLPEPPGTSKDATGRLAKKKNNTDMSVTCGKLPNTLMKERDSARKRIIDDISKDQNKQRNFDQEKHGPYKETNNNLISKKQNNSSRNNNPVDLTGNNTVDDDCISLYAESIYFTEAENPATNVEKKPPVASNNNNNKTYEMNDKVIDSYINGNKAEFLKDFKIVIENEKCKEPPKTHCNPPPKKRKSNVKRLRRVIEWKYIFSDCCFSMLKVGICYNSPCGHSHNFVRFIRKLYNDHGPNILEIMNYLTTRNCCYFSKMLYKELIKEFSYELICNMFGKLYNRGLIDEDIVQLTIEHLLQKKSSIQRVINDITKLIYNNDWETAEFILNVVEKHIRIGNYWNALKKLVSLVQNPNAFIIDKILRECVQVRKQDAPEINTHLIAKLDTKIISQLNSELLLRFKNILCPEAAGKKDPRAKQILQNNQQKRDMLPPIMSPISSISEFELPKKLDNVFNGKQDAIVAEKCNEPSFSNVPKSPDPENNVVDVKANNDYVLHEITDLPKPSSAYGKQRFWKFYVDLHSLQQGLEHGDYDHVVRILQKGLDSNDETVFSRACYQLLCKEIKRCPKHLKEIVALTVQTGTNDALRKMLIDIGVCILIHLADKEYWVLAYQLLKGLKMQFYEINAAVTILFAEVYLANQYALKAYFLLKHSNIIYTDRSRWTVPNNEKDDYIRARIVRVLLDALCEVSPELALFLFEFLIDDQFNNFYPIDLPRAAHRMISIFLLKDGTELLTHLAKLILKYNLGLDAIHCRTLIARLFNIDMCLAKQLYQNAIGVGVYSRVKFSPAPHAIINTDWTKEEVHLALLELIRQLLLNIGHGLDKIKPTELSVYLIFEMIPTTKQLYRDTPKNKHWEPYFQRIKILLKQILLNEFSPSLTLIRRYTGKVCKFNQFNLLAHLKENLV